MSEPALKIDVEAWVESARPDPVLYQQRQAIEITLHAIARTAPLYKKMCLKGGILMGLAHGSPRQTTDIDLTAIGLHAEEGVGDKIRRLLDSAFPPAAAALGYANLVIRTHSVKKIPKAIFETANFPALKLKIASAGRRTPQERALRAGKAAGVLIEIDISFNEPLPEIQVLEMTDGRALLAYSLVDLIAEKYRAMLQQVTRRRQRRQDVYDLDRLILRNEVDEECRSRILKAFVTKCWTRNLDPTRASLDDPEIKKRSGSEWDTMELELGELPDFEGCFARVCEFYRSLPWDSRPTRLARSGVVSRP